MDEKSKKLSGRPVSYIDFNLFFYGQMDPDAVPITKESLDYLKAIKPKTETSIGKLIVSSTASGNGHWFNDVWNESK